MTSRKFPAQLRLQSELDDLCSSIKSDNDASFVFFSDMRISAVADKADLCQWTLRMSGPPDTPYAGMTYSLDFQFPSGYPFKPPWITFNTPIWHPNISWKTGAICLGNLVDQWTPTLTIRSVLHSIYCLMLDPDTEDPVDIDAAEMYKQQHGAFVDVARNFTAVFASQDRAPSVDRRMQELCNLGVVFRGSTGPPLNEHLISRARGQFGPPPAGFLLYDNSDVGTLVLRHISSHICVLSTPIQPVSEYVEEARVLLYHYTNKKAFQGICKKSELWATLLTTCANTKDVCYGEGVYMTALGPADFGSQKSVLINNFTNALDPATQTRHIQPHIDNAAFCIPVLVPHSLVTNVMCDATPQMIHGPGYTRHGERVRADRNIWVLTLTDLAGHVVNVKESVEVLLERIRDTTDVCIRRVAVSKLGQVGFNDARALSSLVSRLQEDEDADVRRRAAEAIGIASDQYDLPIAKQLVASLAREKDSKIRKSVVETLGKSCEKLLASQIKILEKHSHAKEGEAGLEQMLFQSMRASVADLETHIQAMEGEPGFEEMIQAMRDSKADLETHIQEQISRLLQMTKLRQDMHSQHVASLKNLRLKQVQLAKSVGLKRSREQEDEGFAAAMMREKAPKHSGLKDAWRKRECQSEAQSAPSSSSVKEEKLKKEEVWKDREKSWEQDDSSKIEVRRKTCCQM